ncbi:hypothetical protein C0992_008824, partial [Termitomyces sp. T32_za158]
MGMCDAGGYFFIPHHSFHANCHGGKARVDALEDYERKNDTREQDFLRHQGPTMSYQYTNTTQEETTAIDMDIVMDGNTVNLTERLPPADQSVPNEADLSLLSRLQNVSFQQILQEKERQELEDDDDIETEEVSLENSPVNGLRTEFPSTAPTNELPCAAPAGFDPPAAYGRRLDRMDCFGNPIRRIVHTNGVHYISVIACECCGMDVLVEDTIHSQLVPSTFVRTRTYFTTAVLDDFRLTNLECKASAYQYWQKIARITSPIASSGEVDNLYRELRRISRSWRWLKKLKWAGFGHDGTKQPMKPDRGELAIFCPACPQSGVNLPSDWEEDPDQWKFNRSLMMDGNFKADHVRHRKPARDVWHSEGGGMMAMRDELEDYLKRAKEKPTVSDNCPIRPSSPNGLYPLLSVRPPGNIIPPLQGAPCENTFKAIEKALMINKSCDVTGIVATACTRHGCFAPNSVTNLTRGE